MNIKRPASVLFLVIATSCGGEHKTPAVPDFQMLQGTAIGTTWMVKWKGPSEDKAFIQSRIETELEKLDQRMSTWRKDSELNGIQNTNLLIILALHLLHQVVLSKHLRCY